MKHNQFKTVLVGIMLFSFLGCEIEDFKGTKEDDRLEMSNLRKEIDQMAQPVSCENASEWKFTPIGAKACGGPVAYIAYSTKIDETLFLEKVAMYTQKQKAFNVKWTVGSDCAMVTPPKSIECIDGKPAFVY